MSMAGIPDPASGQSVPDAFDRIKGVLQNYDLPPSLANWALGELQLGRSEAGITNDLYQQPDFLQRFPAIKVRQQKGLAPIGPSEYLSYERNAQQLAKEYNLPEGFLSKDKIDQLIGSDVSATEFSRRLADGYTKVQTANPLVRQAFERFTGVGQGDSALAAFFADPDHATPFLEQMTNSANLAGQVGGALHSDISQDTATQLAQAGISEFRLRAGLEQLSQQAPLTTQTVSEAAKGTGVSADEAAKAQFGLDSGSVAQFKKTQEERQAAFSGGGGAVEQQGAEYGLGAARPS